MEEKKELVKERRTVLRSPADFMSSEDWAKWRRNLLKYTAVYLAAFFGQLMLGVEPKAASLVALTALYGALADFFNKYKSESVILTEPTEPTEKPE